MTYVDGYVMLVPKKNRKAYKEMAMFAARVWKECGALKYIECVGDDLNPDMGGVKIGTFPKLTKVKKGDEIWYSFVIYKSKTHRDSVNKKVMREMEKTKHKWEGKKMPFEMKKMFYGGFKALVEK